MFNAPLFDEPPTIKAPAAAIVTPSTDERRSSEQRTSVIIPPPPPPPRIGEILPNGPAPGVVYISNVPRPSAPDGQFNCVVCLQDQDYSSLMIMPCCGNTLESSIKFCRTCIGKIAETGIRSYIGKCPMCPLHFTLGFDGLVQICQEQDVPQICRLCHCECEGVDPEKKLCPLCVIGSENFFRYECEDCHNVQSVPHPLWMSQPLPGEYSVNTWMCYSSECRAPKRWRILPEEMKKIPPIVRWLVVVRLL